MKCDSKVMLLSQSKCFDKLHKEICADDHQEELWQQFQSSSGIGSSNNQRTIAEIASEYEVHANQITKWKRQVLDELPSIFSDKHEKTARPFKLNYILAFARTRLVN